MWGWADGEFGMIFKSIEHHELWLLMLFIYVSVFWFSFPFSIFFLFWVLAWNMRNKTKKTSSFWNTYAQICVLIFFFIFDQNYGRMRKLLRKKSLKRYITRIVLPWIVEHPNIMMWVGLKMVAGFCEFLMTTVKWKSFIWDICMLKFFLRFFYFLIGEGIGIILGFLVVLFLFRIFLPR